MSAVSVVIPCFNARRWLGATIGSVVAQALPGLEIIVVDDGSTDGSSEFVAQAFPGVRLVRTEQGGPSRARNIGTRVARGRFIQYLDADDLLAAGKLEAQVELLERSGADVAYGDWRELRPSPDGGFEPGPLVISRIDGELEIALFTNFWCPPASYLFRRTIVEATGGWDERLPIIQDARFVLDCALHAGQFAYWSGLTAYYRVHATGSVSTRDGTAFTRDCLHNAVSVEEWWRRHGGLTCTRVAALLTVYGHIARNSFGRDESTFETAYAALERLHPGYAPAHPWHLALASRLVGYRRAETLAVYYRQAKQRLRDGARRLERRYV